MLQDEPGTEIRSILHVTNVWLPMTNDKYTCVTVCRYYCFLLLLFIHSFSLSFAKCCSVFVVFTVLAFYFILFFSTLNTSLISDCGKSTVVPV